jgi:hypothetical protein
MAFHWRAFHSEHGAIVMTKTLRILSVAALLATSTAASGMAAGTNEAGQTGSQSLTGTQLGSPQQGTPATGSTGVVTGTSNNGGVPGMSAQSSGQRYPGVVGPTGSTQPDATNPSRSSPNGGGTENGGNGAGNSSR